MKDKPLLRFLSCFFKSLLFIVLVAAPVTAGAWPCRVRLQAYGDALVWMPAIVQRLERVYGVDPRPVLCGRTPRHLRTRQQIIAFFRDQAQNVATGLHQRGDFRSFLRLMPQSARILLDIYDPGRYAPWSPYHPVFYRYVMRQRYRIQRVFYGYSDERLERGDWAGWLAAAQHYAYSWRRGFMIPPAWGLPRQPEAWLQMDYRSPAFAMAALNLQRAVTDMVRYWIHVWSKGHGSMRGLPAPRRKGIFLMRRRIRGSHEPFTGTSGGHP